MNEQLQFLEHMNTIARIGKEHQGKITRQEVQDELKDIPLNDAQWEVMGEFLFSRQVMLEGYIPSKGEEEKPAYQFSTEEQNFMKYYEADLESISKKTEQELEELLQQLKEGQQEAVEDYTVLLPRIYEIAKGYADGKEQLGDLVQEANLKAFTLLEEGKAIQEPEILKALVREIELTLKAFIAKGEDTNLETNKIADKLNQLVEAVEVLKEQNVDYSIEDLAEFLDIPVEEIEKLLKIAGEE